MLKRKISNQLQNWKNKSSGSRWLCLLGIRKTGKSTLLRQFGNENYKAVLTLDFLKNPQAKSIFEQKDPQKILSAITAFTHTSLIPGSTLVILDEIQECPQALSLLPLLAAETDADWIAAGIPTADFSRSDFFRQNGESVLYLHPLDFEEFLWAIGLPAETIEYLKDCYKTCRPVQEAIHQDMLKNFYLYMLVGGMPEAVETFAKTNSPAAVERIQKDILYRYRQQIQNHPSFHEGARIQKIFMQIPAQLDGQNNRFKLNALGHGQRISRLNASFAWLQKTGLTLSAFNLHRIALPLREQKKPSLFRLYLPDTGLLGAAFAGNVQFPLLNGETAIRHGRLLENVFAQHLIIGKNELYYFETKGIGKADFVVSGKDGIDLLVLEHGDSFTRQSAVNKVLNDADPCVKNVLVFYKGNLAGSGPVVCLPYYMLMFYRPAS